MACHFKIHKVKDQGYVSLESRASPGIKIGMMKDGKVRPTVDTGDKNVRLYPEVVQCKSSIRGTERQYAYVRTRIWKLQVQYYDFVVLLCLQGVSSAALATCSPLRTASRSGSGRSPIGSC